MGFKAFKNGRSVHKRFIQEYIDQGSWENQASCKSHDPELFLYEPDSPPQGGYREALEICSGCPVFLDCAKSACETDFYWTVRAGRPPRAYLDKKNGVVSAPPILSSWKRPPPNQNEGKEKCVHGHSSWKTLKNGHRRCMDCARQYDRARKAQKRAANMSI